MRPTSSRRDLGLGDGPVCPSSGRRLGLGVVGGSVRPSSDRRGFGLGGGAALAGVDPTAAGDADNVKAAPSTTCGRFSVALSVAFTGRIRKELFARGLWVVALPVGDSLGVGRATAEDSFGWTAAGAFEGRAVMGGGGDLRAPVVGSA